MPYRAMGIWGVLLGIVGVGLLAVLLLLGRDVRSAARTGAGWKRAPLAAALALLAALGLTAATDTSCIFTCYVPAPGAGMERKDFQARLEELDRQIPLLEKYAAADKIDPQVAARVLDTAENDVYLLRSGFAQKKLKPEEYQRARQLADSAQASIEKLSARLDREASTEPYRVRQGEGLP
jgi:hypothetical protein